MISLCWKRVNMLPDADYDELNTYQNSKFRTYHPRGLKAHRRGNNNFFRNV